jgi:hypothetical protein
MRNILKWYHEIIAISVILSSWPGGMATYVPETWQPALSSLPIWAQIVKVSWDYLIKYNNTTIWELELYESSWYELNDVVVIREWVDTSVTTTPITLQEWDIIYVAFRLSAYRVTLASDNPNFWNWMNETTWTWPINYIDVPTDYAFAAVDVQWTGQYMNKPWVMLARDPNDPFQDYVLLSANSWAMALLWITYYDWQWNSYRITTVDQFGVVFSSNVKFEMNLWELYDLVSDSSFISVLDACRRDPTMIWLTTDWQVSANWWFCNDNWMWRYIYVCVGSMLYDYTQPRPFPIIGAEFAVVKYDRNNNSYVYSNFDLNTMPSWFDNYYDYLLQVQNNGSESSLTQLYNNWPYQDKSSYWNWMASYFNS